MAPTLAVFAYGGVSSRTLGSILAEAGHAPWQVVVADGDAAIDRMRSKVATQFIESPGSDVLAMVDHDIEWRTGDLTHIAELAAEKESVVGGLVSKKAIGRGFGGRFGDGQKHEIGGSELVELGPEGYVGGAFIAIHRKVLEDLAKKYPKVRTGFHPLFCPMMRKNDTQGVVEYLSEDWSFCERVKRAEHKLYVSMKAVTIHWGEYGFTPITASRRQ